MKVQKELEQYSKQDVDNPIFIMMSSKARGNVK